LNLEESELSFYTATFHKFFFVLVGDFMFFINLVQIYLAALSDLDGGPSDIVLQIFAQVLKRLVHFCASYFFVKTIQNLVESSVSFLF
jgi:hypothetical protein